MQFSIRNLYCVVWLQKNHMESLRSGVEPFILCAEFLNVDISKIAVMATLTVNLLHPCNVSPSCSSFPFLSGGPVWGDKRSGLIQRCRQNGRWAREYVLFPDRMGWELSWPCSAEAQWPFMQNCGQRPAQGHECWEWRCLAVDGGIAFPRAVLPVVQSAGVNLKEITHFFSCTAGTLLLRAEENEVFLWGIWYFA